MNFNEKQQEAINHKEGACAVIAGAGAGKTSVLIERIHSLVNSGVSQSDILVISFTKAISQELRQKLIKQNLTDINAGTFHSICRNILNQNGYNISVDAIDRPEKGIIEIEKAFRRVNKNIKRSKILELKSFIDYQKVYMNSYNDEFEPKECSIPEDQIREYFKAYEDYKLENKLYDFTDWLLMCYNFIKGKPQVYKYILVDEHQDNNYLRNMLIYELGKNGNVFVVGDYRQSIYGFNGAVSEMFMKFDENWSNAKVINMDYNYRSCKNIVDNANDFAKLYYGTYKHFSKSLSNNTAIGNITFDTYYLKEDEAKKTVEKIKELIKNGESPNDIAVLYRFNSHSDYIEKELKENKIKYTISKQKSFFDRKEIKLIVSYLKLINDLKDDMAFEDVFRMRNYPIMYISNNDYNKVKTEADMKKISYYDSFITYKRYGGYNSSENVLEFKNNMKKLIEKWNKRSDLKELIDQIIKVFKINDYIEENYEPNDAEIRKESIVALKSFIKDNNLGNFLSFINGENDFKKKEEKDGVKLMTIHASKGLEFKNVFIISIEDDKFPCHRSPLSEEANLMYVAVTRAKENLYLSEIGCENRFMKEYKKINKINYNKLEEVI